MTTGNEELRRTWAWIRKRYPSLDAYGDSPWNENNELDEDAYNAYKKLESESRVEKVRDVIARSPQAIKPWDQEATGWMQWDERGEVVPPSELADDEPPGQGWWVRDTPYPYPLAQPSLREPPLSAPWMEHEEEAPPAYDPAFGTTDFEKFLLRKSAPAITKFENLVNLVAEPVRTSVIYPAMKRTSRFSPYAPPDPIKMAEAQKQRGAGLEGLKDYIQNIKEADIAPVGLIPRLVSPETGEPIDPYKSFEQYIEGAKEAPFHEMFMADLLLGGIGAIPKIAGRTAARQAAKGLARALPEERYDYLFGKRLAKDGAWTDAPRFKPPKDIVSKTDDLRKDEFGRARSRPGGPLDRYLTVTEPPTVSQLGISSRGAEAARRRGGMAESMTVSQYEDAIARGDPITLQTARDPRIPYEETGISQIIKEAEATEAVPTTARAADEGIPGLRGKYDMTWETFVKETGFDYQTIRKSETDPDAWGSMISFVGASPEDTVFIKYGNSVQAGINEEILKRKIIRHHIARDFYTPPRIDTPSWVKNIDDPLPKVPEEEIDFYDVPGWYQSKKYNDALLDKKLAGSSLAKKLVRYAGETTVDIRTSGSFMGTIGQSQKLTDIWDTGVNVAEVISRKLMVPIEDITNKKIESVRKVFKNATEASLIHRGLPEKFYVFRGGAAKGAKDTPTSVTLDPDIAAKWFGQGRQGIPDVRMYEVNRSDILLDVDSVLWGDTTVDRFTGAASREIWQHKEQELIVRIGSLKNPRKVNLPRTKDFIGEKRAIEESLKIDEAAPTTATRVAAEAVPTTAAPTTYEYGTEAAGKAAAVEEAVEVIPEGGMGMGDPAIEEIISRVRTKGVVASDKGIEAAQEKISGFIKRVMDSGKKAKDVLSKPEKGYIKRRTGYSPSQIDEAIESAKRPPGPPQTRQVVASKSAEIAAASDIPWYQRFMARLWSSHWGISGLQTGYGKRKRILPYGWKGMKGQDDKRITIPEEYREALPENLTKAIEETGRIPVKQGGLYDLKTMIANYAGLAGSGVLRSVMASLGAKDIAKTSVRAGTFGEDINRYWAAKHAIEIFTEKPDREFVGHMYKNIKEAQNDIRLMHSRLGQEGITEVHNAVLKIIDDVYRLDLDRYVKGGFISEDLAISLKNKYPFYNPIRYLDDWDKHLSTFSEGSRVPRQGTSVDNHPLKPLSEVGSDAEIMNPLDYLAGGAIKAEQRIRLNQIKRATILHALNTNVAGVKKAKTKVKMIQASGDEKVFRSYVDEEGTIGFYDPSQPGVRQVYDAPEWLILEMRALGKMYSHDWLAHSNSWFRGVTTTYNPTFIVKNVFNDMFTAAMTEGVIPTRSLKELRTVLFNLETDEFAQAYILGGGRQQRFFGESPEDIAKRTGLVDEINNNGGEVVTLKEALSKSKSLLDTIPKIGEAGELMPRFAAARRTLNRLDPSWEKKLADGRLTVQQLSETPAMQAAIRDGVEATVAFSQGGAWIKSLNRYLLFLNATMEGVKRPHRAFQKNPKQFTTMMAGAMLMQAGITAYNMTNPAYFDIPLRERLTSLVIMLPGRRTRPDGTEVPRRINVIPALREWAVGLGMTTYAVHRIFEERPTDFWKTIRTLIPEVTPLGVAEEGFMHGFMPFVPPMPEVAEIVVEQLTNYDMFRNKPITPEDLAMKEPSLQTHPWTSPSIKGLTSIAERYSLPDTFASPVKVQHMYNRLTGGTGRILLDTSDWLVGITSDSSPEVQRLVDEYRELGLGEESFTRRREMLTGLDTETAKQVKEEATRDVSRPPIIGSLERAFAPRFAGEEQRTQSKLAEEATGISAEQTQKAFGALDQFTKDRLEDQKRADKTVRLERDSIQDRSDRIAWREAHRRRGAKYAGGLELLESMFGKAVQFATNEDRNLYYEIINRWAEAQGYFGQEYRHRDRAKILAVGYYSIQPDQEGLNEADVLLGEVSVDKMYREREKYRDNLSTEDRKLLDDYLNSTRTPVQRRYYDDLREIKDTGFWDIIPIALERHNAVVQFDEYNDLYGQAKKEYLNKNPNLKNALNEARVQRDTMRQQNLELENKLMYWGFYTTPIFQKFGLQEQMRGKAGYFTPTQFINLRTAGNVR